MLKHWQSLLNTDCRVVVKDGRTLYPIFKNGSTSLFLDADRVLTNHEIVADDVTVFIRDPRVRFVQGVNQYCVFNHLDVHETYQKIKTGDLTDRHFAPQWMWLLHLYKYHKGTVTLKEMRHMADFTKVHHDKNRFDTVEVEPLSEYVYPDMPLLSHINNTIPLKEIIEDHVLSKA